MSPVASNDPHSYHDAIELHRLCPPIDLHADSLLWSHWLGYDFLKRHQPPLPRAMFGGHVDLPRLREGGLGGQFLGVVTLPGIESDLFESCLRQIECLGGFVGRSDGALRLVTSATALEESRGGSEMSVLLGVEGAQPLEGRVDRVKTLAEKGVRYLGLLHFSANECGAPALGMGADIERGLTRFGFQVIQSCEHHGVIVDLTHINRRGFFDAVKVSRQPVIVSHTACAALHPLWRNTDDAQLRAVANTGGVVGVIFCPVFLGQDGIDAVVEHILHVRNTAGEQVVALGSDWDGFIRPTRGLESAERLPRLTARLLERGVEESFLRKLLRENVVRVLREVPPIHHEVDES